MNVRNYWNQCFCLINCVFDANLEKKVNRVLRHTLIFFFLC